MARSSNGRGRMAGLSCRRSIIYCLSSRSRGFPRWSSATEGASRARAQLVRLSGTSGRLPSPHKASRSRVMSFATFRNSTCLAPEDPRRLKCARISGGEFVRGQEEDDFLVVVSPEGMVPAVLRELYRQSSRQPDAHTPAIGLSDSGSQSPRSSVRSVKKLRASRRTRLTRAGAVYCLRSRSNRCRRADRPDGTRQPA